MRRAAFEIIGGFLTGVLLGLITYILFKNMYIAIAFGTISDVIVMKILAHYKVK